MISTESSDDGGGTAAEEVPGWVDGDAFSLCCPRSGEGAGEGGGRSALWTDEASGLDGADGDLSVEADAVDERAEAP